MNACASIAWFELTTYYTPRIVAQINIRKLRIWRLFLQIPKLLPRRIDTIGGTACIVYIQINLKGQRIMRENKQFWKLDIYNKQIYFRFLSLNPKILNVCPFYISIFPFFFYSDPASSEHPIHRFFFHITVTGWSLYLLLLTWDQYREFVQVMVTIFGHQGFIQKNM